VFTTVILLLQILKHSSVHESNSYSEHICPSSVFCGCRLVKANTCPAEDAELESSCDDCVQTSTHTRSGRTTFNKVRLNITTLQVISMPSFDLNFYYFIASLADSTNGRAYATVLRLSFVVFRLSSSVTLCIVAKRCVLTAYRKSYMRNRLVPK